MHTPPWHEWGIFIDSRTRAVSIQNQVRLLYPRCEEDSRSKTNLAPIASYFGVYWNERFRSGEPNSCEVFFSFPRRSPGYMTVNYLRSGPGTEYLTIRSSVDFLEVIARSRGCRAIVCEDVSSRISDRLMKRWGYVAHAAGLGPGHYIRRLETLNPNL